MSHRKWGGAVAAMSKLYSFTPKFWIFSVLWKRSHFPRGRHETLIWSHFKPSYLSYNFLFNSLLGTGFLRVNDNQDASMAVVISRPNLDKGKSLQVFSFSFSQFLDLGLNRVIFIIVEPPRQRISRDQWFSSIISGFPLLPIQKQKKMTWRG